MQLYVYIYGCFSHKILLISICVPLSSPLFHGLFRSRIVEACRAEACLFAQPCLSVSPEDKWALKLLMRQYRVLKTVSVVKTKEDSTQRLVLCVGDWSLTLGRGAYNNWFSLDGTKIESDGFPGKMGILKLTSRDAHFSPTLSNSPVAVKYPFKTFRSAAIDNWKDGVEKPIFHSSSVVWLFYHSRPFSHLFRVTHWSGPMTKQKICYA